ELIDVLRAAERANAAVRLARDVRAWQRCVDVERDPIVIALEVKVVHGDLAHLAEGAFRGEPGHDLVFSAQMWADVVERGRSGGKGRGGRRAGGRGGARDGGGDGA